MGIINYHYVIKACHCTIAWDYQTIQAWENAEWGKWILLDNYAYLHRFVNHTKNGRLFRHKKDSSTYSVWLP